MKESIGLKEVIFAAIASNLKLRSQAITSTLDYFSKYENRFVYFLLRLLDGQEDALEVALEIQRPLV